MTARKDIIKKSIAKDLNDQQTQAEILQPAGVEVTLGGNAVRIYPLSGYDVRALTGFAAGIFIESGADDDARAQALRVMPVITRPGNAAQVLSFLTRATFASPKDAEAAPKKQFARVFEDLNAATAGAKGAFELAMAFVTLCEQNDVQDVAEAITASAADDEDDDAKKEE